jgi:hypothetical protein
MVLTAESGWSFGEWGYGEDKKKELRAELDKYRKEEGLPPVDWSEDEAQSVRGTDEHRPDAAKADRSSRTQSRDTAQEKAGPRVRRM